MVNIWIPSKKIYCPLCDDEFQEKEARYNNMKTTVYYCRFDRIFTFPFDPAFDKWRDTDKTIPCGNCGHKNVRWFLRHMDDYFKTVCLECGVETIKDSQAGFDKNGLVELEDFKENQGEHVGTIHIPVKMLKMSEERRRLLLKKIQEKNFKEGL